MKTTPRPADPALRSLYLEAIAASGAIAADPSERADMRRAARDTAAWYRGQVARMG